MCYSGRCCYEDYYGDCTKPGWVPCPCENSDAREEDEDEELLEEYDEDEEPEPGRGYCQCGCGQKTQIAKRTDKSKGWIKGQPLDYVKGHNLSTATRQKSDMALGHKTFDPNGYVRVQTSHGRKYQHVLIAEQMIGRHLRYFGKGNPNNEIVHHKNGNKSDNSPMNLVVMTHAEHIALHDAQSPRRDCHA